ncbi:MAG: hypothetical protein V4507_10455 [Verrucomicrobiota bacterium]
MARCILTGTASIVMTYLIWRVVQTISVEVPVMFLSTCLLVGFVSVVSPSLAIYRIAKHKPMIRKEGVASKARKSETQVCSSDMVLAVSVDRSDGAWYQRN